MGNRPIRIEIGITEAEIRIEFKQLSRKIVTALAQSDSYDIKQGNGSGSESRSQL